MARRRPPRHDGLYGTPRRAPRASRRARPGHAARHHRADELPAAARATERGGAGRSGEGVHRALRARPRLSQGAAREARSGSPRAFARRSATFGYRVFTDSAPVLEVALAAKSGIGWRGKHTLLLTREAGSWFFLGEIYTDLPLPRDAPAVGALRHVHRVHRRLPDAGDRRALRARRAPLHLVSDDRASPAAFPRSCGRSSATGSTAATTASSSARGTGMRALRPKPGFAVRHGLDDADLSRCSRGPSANSCERTRRQRDPADRLRALVAQPRGRRSATRRTIRAIVAALEARADDPSPLVREHVAWALARQRAAGATATASAPT